MRCVSLSARCTTRLKRWLTMQKMQKMYSPLGNAPYFLNLNSTYLKSEEEKGLREVNTQIPRSQQKGSERGNSTSDVNSLPEFSFVVWGLKNFPQFFLPPLLFSNKLITPFDKQRTACRATLNVRVELDSQRALSFSRKFQSGHLCVPHSPVTFSKHSDSDLVVIEGLITSPSTAALPPPQILFAHWLV